MKNIKELFAKNRHYRAELTAKALIKLYREGSDLDATEIHVLNDCAAEHGQILDNVVHMSWFLGALTENLEALDGTP